MHSGEQAEFSSSGLTRREMLALSATAAIGFARPATRATASEGTAATMKRPNFLVFLADDQGIEHVGCYGNKIVRTPHIDRLAGEGLRFTRAFTPTAMCAPSRSALYTGLHPHRNGAHANHSRVRPGVKSLPHYLQPLGYRVGLAGKGHIGPDEAFRFERMRHHGRDIGKFLDGDGPFCLVIASNQPHGPHSKQTPYKPEQMPVQPHHVDTPQMRNLMTHYYADIDQLDREVGQTMQMLRQRDLEQNTIVVYASDHGFTLFAKWTCYEAGLHVPMIVRWPGVVRPQQTTDAMVSFVDVVPTFIELAGGKAIDSLDGRSFAGLLQGKTTKRRDLIFGAHTNLGIHHGEPYPVRSVRDARYKYIRNLLPGATFKCVVTHEKDGSLKESGLFASWREAAKTDKHAAARVGHLLKRPAEELYDLESDPHELTNLAARRELAAKKKQLSDALDRWMKAQGDPGAAAETHRRK